MINSFVYYVTSSTFETSHYEIGDSFVNLHRRLARYDHGLELRLAESPTDLNSLAEWVKRLQATPGPGGTAAKVRVTIEVEAT